MDNCTPFNHLSYCSASAAAQWIPAALMAWCTACLQLPIACVKLGLGLIPSEEEITVRTVQCSAVQYAQMVY